MLRPTSDHYELSETEKRDLIKRIEEGKPLPERYRFLLFEDKREVELVWNGKTREVCTAVLPFQTLEHIKFCGSLSTLFGERIKSEFRTIKKIRKFR